MPLYSLKVQTLVTRWKLFRGSSSAIFVDDAVLQWLLYCVCVDTRRGSVSYSVFVGKRDSSNWNSLLGMKLGCTSTILKHKRNPWHASIHGLPPSKNLRHQPALGNWWRQCFGTCMMCFCCTFLLLMKQSILLLIRPLSKNLRELFNARSLRCRTRGCCCCMTVPDRMKLMRQWIFWNDGAGKFLNTRTTARIWHLRTFISSRTWKNISVPNNSNHMMMSSMRCKHGCLARIPPSNNSVFRNGFPT